MIGKNSARIQVVLTKDEVKKLQGMADKEQRSISNIGSLLIRKALKLKK